MSEFVDDAGRYARESRIATGGMGEVWRGTDTILHRPVAIKILKAEYADDATFRTRFATEARHAAALHHPGVAQVFDFGEADAGDGTTRPFLVMELVDGQPLSDLLRPGAPMDPEAVRDLIAQAADAIGAAHRAGIVHRDVKPGNLLVTPDRKVKITDFGIARAAEGVSLTQTGQVVGTPHYISPEQASGEPTSSASDVYALGVVLFECLTGRRPFHGDSPVTTALAHLRQPVPDLPESVPADLRAVTTRALAKDPAERYVDGAVLAAALRGRDAVPPAGAGPAATTQVLPTPAPAPGASAAAAPAAAAAAASASDDEPPVTPERPAGDDRGRRGFRWLWAIVGVVVLIALVALLLSLLGNGDETPSADETSPTGRTASTKASNTESSAPSTPTTSAEPDVITIDESDYIGRPVDEVKAELKDRGLKVDTEKVDNPGDETEGDVSGVDPTGDLEEGDTVTVSFWGKAPKEEPTTDTPTTGLPTESPTDSTGPGNGGGNGNGNGADTQSGEGKVTR